MNWKNQTRNLCQSPGPNIEQDYNPETMTTKCLPKDCEFRSLVMELYWVGRCTRKEILYACNFYSRFMNCYTVELYKYALYTLLYLKGTREVKQTFFVKPFSKIEITFVADASFATLQSKSVIGVAGYINDCLFTASSTTIKGYPTSSCESESYGTFDACKLAIYTKNWLSEFTKCNLPMFVFNDNKAAILILGRPTNSGRSKHYDVKFRYVNELVEKGLIQLCHITRENG